MYLFLKKIISKLIPKKIIFKNESILRNIIGSFYIGKNHECNVCKKKLRRFISINNSDLLCPFCGSRQRTRRLWQLLENELLTDNCRVLDFSPSRCLYRQLKKRETINYTSTDLSEDFIADHQWDITNIPAASNSYDLIVCYHILEHIQEDNKAMEELERILAPGGKIIIQTPFKEGKIYENDAIVSERDRIEHFGQKDHVRIYSVAGLKSRLENFKLKVTVLLYNEISSYNGLNDNEIILLASKS